MKEETYTDRVRYFATRSPRNPIKRYIRVELPNDSFFAPNEFVTVTISGDGEMPFNQNSSKELASYSLLRDMKVGDELTFPYEKWNSLRSTASYLKRFYGVIYSVRKSGPNKQHGDIIVTRLK